MKSDTYKILFSLVILNTLMSPGYKLSLSIQHCFSALYVSVYMFFISPVCSPCTSLCFVSFVFSLFLPATMCSVKAEITLPHRLREEHLDRWRVSRDCESIAFKLNHFILFRYVQSSQLSFPLTWHFITFV